MSYGPYICIGIVLLILFVLWVFWGGKNYEFVGLAPLSPDTCGSYTGSFYTWGNQQTFNFDQGGNISPVEYNPAGLNITPADTSSTVNIVIDNTPSIEHNSLQGNICLQDIPDISDTPNISNVQSLSEPTNPAGINNVSNFNRRDPALFVAPPPVQKRGRVPFVSRGERMCCQTMQQIYGVPFKSIRPDWLKNPETGENLELDCYNDELKIAVEYNGEQHYKWPNFTNQTYEQFINQVRRDNFKVGLCDRNGVYLITVPYNVNHNDIPSFIISHLPETIQKRIQEERSL